MLHGVFKLLIDHITRGCAHRTKIDGLQIGMREATGCRPKRREPNTENEEALFFADLDAVIKNPHPVISVRFWPCQFIKPQAQQPQSPRPPGTRRERNRQGNLGRNNANCASRSTKTRHGRKYQGDEQQHQPHGIVVILGGLKKQRPVLGRCYGVRRFFLGASDPISISNSRTRWAS